MKRFTPFILMSIVFLTANAAEPSKAAAPANTGPIKMAQAAAKKQIAAKAQLAKSEANVLGLILKKVPGGILAQYTSRARNTACSVSCDNGQTYWHWSCSPAYPYCGADCSYSPPKVWCYRE